MTALGCAWLTLGIAIAVTSIPRKELHAQQLRDSAGIVIVENESPALPPTRMWRISPQPYFQIGLADGDSLYEFLRVMGLARLSDGRIAVGNGGTNTIRLWHNTEYHG